MFLARALYLEKLRQVETRLKGYLSETGEVGRRKEKGRRGRGREQGRGRGREWGSLAMHKLEQWETR